MATNQPHVSRMNISPEKVTFGVVQYPQGGTFGVRRQADWQLVLLDAGQCCIEIDGQVHTLPVNHVALLSPNHLEFFRFSETQISIHRWCAVAPSLVSPELHKVCLAAPFCLPISSNVHQLIEMGLGLVQGSPRGVHQLEQLGLLVLGQFLLDAEQMHSSLPVFVLRAKQMLEAQSHTDLQVQDLAKACFVTPQHLIRSFKQHFDTTPARYLWKLRVQRGAELLCSSGLTVAEIAERCGFQTPFHFARLVKQHYGLSPTTLRQRVWARQPHPKP
jgi:AraC-like DNA-binding protein